MSTKEISGVRRRLYIALAVLSILALITCFYYYYISNKEQKLQERNLRILHRIEENFERRISDNRQLIISRLRVCGECMDARGKIKPETLKEILKSDETFSYEEAAQGNTSKWEILGKGKNSRIYFYISNSELKQKSDSNYYIKISANVEKILTGILRYDVFPSYILAGKDGLAYNNCREICEVPAKDSLLKNDNISELKIGNGSFYVFSHPFSQGKDQGIILSGIIPAHQYTHDKYSVPDNFLLAIFLLLLVILLAFPFIKSFLVSAEETLDIIDILLALLSLFLLCYMYVFMHMNRFTVSIDERQKKEMLQTTNDSIKHAFLSELSNMRRQLQDYDRIFSGRYYDTTTKNSAGVQERQIRLIPKFYPNFYRVYWLNNKGIQITDLIRGTDTFYKPTDYIERDYHDRDYFKAALNKALWYPESPDSDKIYLESVYSRIDGSFRAVMSKESNIPSVVAAIAAEMNSVINTILPREIDFCLLDRKGNILFTSAGSEHINENLLEECSYSKELSAALYARASTFFDRSFIGKDCSFYISPVEGLPLYLVTFTNNSLSEGTQLQVCIFTSLFIISTLILFSLVILFLVFLKGKNKNELIGRPFLDLSLLYPASCYLYRDFGGIFFNCILMAVLAVCSYICRDEPFTLVSLLLVNAFGTTAAFCYARLDLNSLRCTLFWVIVVSFLVLSDILLLYLGGWENKPAFISLVMYELLLLEVIYELRKLRPYEKVSYPFTEKSKGENIPPKHPHIQEYILQRLIIRLQEEIGRRLNVKFYHQFAVMLVTWFALIALLPSVFVYRYFYKNENENRIKSAQIDIARKWYDKSVYRKDENSNPVAPLDSSAVKSYVWGYYQTRLVPGGSCTDKPDIQGIKFNEFLNHFRFSFKPGDSGINAVYPGISDSTIRFCKDKGNLAMTYRNLLNHPRSQGKNVIHIQSKLPGFPRPALSLQNVLPFILYFLAPLLFSFLFYYVINFFLKRFFLFDFVPADNHGDAAYLKRLICDKYKKEPFKLIILGVTSSGKREVIKQAVEFIYDPQSECSVEDKAQKQERIPINDHYFVCDLAEIDLAVRQLRNKKFNRGDVLVLAHFEHNLAEKETNDKKYMLISAIFQMAEQYRPHLVILSSIHPSVFLNNLKAKTTQAGSFKAEDYINRQDYYNWTGILSGFEIYTKMYQDPESDKATAPDHLETYDAYKSKYTFYLSIWNSLDRIEKFVLYDLAKDHLVNYRNKASIYSLYSKGLVVLNDMPPALMNEAFRAFILAEINEEEVELEKRQGGSSSAWNTFRTPFLMIVFGVLLFVFITQQETFNKLMAGLVAFAGSIPMLLKLLSLTQTQEKKAN